MSSSLSMSARCPDCGHVVHVRIKDGSISRHRIYAPHFKEWGGYRLCTGEGKPPARYDPRFDTAMDEVSVDVGPEDVRGRLDAARAVRAALAALEADDA
jgi:hypothetical protein